MRWFSFGLVGIGIGLCIPVASRAAVIGADSFLTTATATSGNYLAGNVNGQTATNGTSGYFTGTASGNQAPGWASGTGAILASTTALTHPLVVNPPSGTPDGSLNAAGNANNRLQYRDLASLTAPVSSSYFFSTLLRESVTSYTGTVYAGLGPSRAANLNASVPTTGFDVGFLNGALALFYNNGGSSLASQVLVNTPSANSTYLVEVAASVNGSAATFTPSVYDAGGTLVNNPAAQAVTGTLSTSDLGAFQLFQTSQFNGGSPSAVNFDEFRFGTAESDVVSTPEPASLSLIGLAAGSLLSRRRRR